MLKETEKEKEKLAKIFGFGIGALTLGTVAIVSAPVAIPAIGIGLGAVGLGGALSGTAIGFGLVGVSAVVGGVVGRVSAPKILDLFKSSNKRGDEEEDRDSNLPKTSPSLLVNQLSRDQGNAPFYPNPRSNTYASSPAGIPTKGEISDIHQRILFINEDFEKVTNNKELLELVDFYRQFAIKKVLDQAGSFDEKKGKIEKIFQATDLNVNLKLGKDIVFESSDGSVENLETLKDRIRDAITKDTDNFPFDVVYASYPVKQDSFSDVELLHRMSYNRIFITGILHTRDDVGVNKHKALEYAYWQHKISGNEQQYPDTLKRQKEYIGGIFSLKDNSQKIAEDVGKHLEKVKSDARHIYFPDDSVHRVYSNEDKRRQKIEDDFAQVTNNKQLLDLVDHYRQFAIEAVVNEGVSFDEKKVKILGIFEKTTVNFNLQTFSMYDFSEDKKNQLKEAILKDPAFAANPEAPVVSSSLSETQLLKRILYNKVFITETLNKEAEEPQKQKALNFAIGAYLATGDKVEFPKTLEAQRNYIDGNTNRCSEDKIDEILTRAAQYDAKNNSPCFDYNNSVLRAYKEDLRAQAAPAPSALLALLARAKAGGAGASSR